MASELSSNWKKLQQTSKRERKPGELKRKAPSKQHLSSQAKRNRIQVKAFRGSAEYPGMAAGSSAEEDNEPSATLASWAEDNDISAKDLAKAYGLGLKDTTVNFSSDIVNGGQADDVQVGQYVAVDCEMVGVGGLEDRSVLARVSIVNYHGTQVYDSFVRPKEFVTDWRTHVSGVSPKNMATARTFEEVQSDVAAILKDRILVGHAIKNDLDAMMLGHPKKDIRDTSRFSGFRKYSAGRTPSLKALAKVILGVDIQGGQHSSIEDARATMLLFRHHKSAFDLEHASRVQRRTAHTGKSKTKKAKKKR
ncbi:MAG: 3'-5' exonuclease [Claussenomyces sp. TS43310]|nr:MAG: 3'-5' exonuclease [Claussenomyces sp. TS43310]